MQREAVIIINRAGFHLYCHLDGTPFISPDRYHIVVLCSPGKETGVPPGACHAVEVVDTLDDRDTLVAYVAAVARERPVRALIGLTEGDVLLMAHVRETLDLPGLRPALAERFRDKPLMKRLAQAAGIPVPGYTTLSDADDLRAFAAAHGAVVVKPTAGTATVDTHYLADAAAIEEFCRHHPGALHHYLAEAYVGGARYHCDSLVLGGQVIFAGLCTVDDSLMALQQLTPITSVVCVDLERELYQRILDLNRRIISALGLEQGCTHCEFLVPDPETIYFGEICARVGGGVSELYRDAYGVELIELWLRMEVGEPIVVAPDFQQYAGSTMFLCRQGVLAELADLSRFQQEWIRGARFPFRVGDSVALPKLDYGVLAIVPFVAPDLATFQARRRYVLEEFTFAIA